MCLDRLEKFPVSVIVARKMIVPKEGSHERP